MAPLEGQEYDYATTYSSSLVCSICLQPFIDPVVLTPCEHIFCLNCITPALEKAGQCPLDRQEVSREELLIRCPYAPQCLDTFPRSQLGHHLKETCGFHPLPCCEKGCQERVSRRWMASHLAHDCHERIVVCKSCGQRMRKGDVEAHESEECDQTLTECHYCRKTMPRVEVKAHDETCELVIVDCVWKEEAGCPWRGPRSELTDPQGHLLDCPYEQIKSYILQSRRRIKELELTNGRLEARLSTQEGDMLELKSTVKHLTEQITPWQSNTASKHPLTPLMLYNRSNAIEESIGQLRSTVSSLELTNSMGLMTESVRLGEEVAGLRMQVDHCKRVLTHLLHERDRERALAVEGNGVLEEERSNLTRPLPALYPSTPYQSAFQPLMRRMTDGPRSDVKL